MKRRNSLLFASLFGSLLLLVVPATLRAQSNLNPDQQKAWNELNEQIELNDKRGMEKVIRKHTSAFKGVFEQFDYELAQGDEIETWKKARLLGELLDTDAGGNIFSKRLDVIQALSLEDRQLRRTKWTEQAALSNALAAAFKNRENDRVNEMIPQLVALADDFQRLDDQLLRAYTLVDVANVLRDADQKVEALKFYQQADEGLTAQGYEKLILHSEIKKQIEALNAAASGKGGDASSDSATSWAKDANGQPVPWSDPIPLKYVADEKLHVSKITTPCFLNSEDTSQWQSFGLSGNGPVAFEERFQPLGRPLKVKREGQKILIDEDGDGKFREVKAQYKPSLVEVEKEFEDPWTKQKVKQKYAFLLGTGSDQETFFGLELNAAPQSDWYQLRYSAGSYLRGNVLGLDVKIIDDNVTGQFGDGGNVTFNAYSKGPSFPMLDAMQIGTAKVAQPFSEFIEVGGEFYRLKMATPDEAYSVKTRKLAIETGTVVLEFKNKLKPEALVISALDRFKGAHFNIASGKPIRVPCDRYSVSYGILRSGAKERMQSCIIVASREMAAIEVKPNAEVKVELGAPYHFVFEPQEVGNGDIKIPGNSVAVKGRGGELYTRFWDSPPIPEHVQLYRDGKSVGKALPMQRGKFEDYKKGGFAALMFPLDLTLPGNGSTAKLGIAMKLKKPPALLDGPIDTAHDASHD